MAVKPKASSTHPPHITTLTRFLQSTSSRLEALVAFGIFTQSERDGGFDANERYSENIDRLFASNNLFCLDEARKALLQAASTAIEEKRRRSQRHTRDLGGGGFGRRSLVHSFGRCF